MRAMTQTPSSDVPATRHGPGRGSQVMPDERRQIQYAHLVDGLNQRQLADRFGRKRETIAGVLKGDDFERLRQDVESELRTTAVRTLKNNVGRAADGWVKAIGKAADRGDHKPSKDLLMHTGVIEPLGEHGAKGNMLMLIGVNIYKDMRTGQQFTDATKSQNSKVLLVAPGHLKEQYEEAGVPWPFGGPPTQEEIEAIKAQQAKAIEAYVPSKTGHTGRVTGWPNRHHPLAPEIVTRFRAAALNSFRCPIARRKALAPYNRPNFRSIAQGEPCRCRPAPASASTKSPP